MNQKIWMFLLLFISFIWINVSASEIKKVDIDINIDITGNANVREVWDVDINEDKRLYRHFYRFDNIGINNIKIYDDNEMEYEEGKYKMDIDYYYRVTNIYWNAYSHMSKKYYLEYTIENFVTKYSDYEGILHNLFYTNEDIDEVNIAIKSDYWNLSNVDVWLYGRNNFKKEINNNQIIITSQDKVHELYYVYLLMSFDKPYFETVNHLDKTFSETKDEISNEQYVTDQYEVLYNGYADFLNNNYLIMILTYPVTIFLAIIAIIKGLIINFSVDNILESMLFFMEKIFALSIIIGILYVVIRALFKKFRKN